MPLIGRNADPGDIREAGAEAGATWEAGGAAGCLGTEPGGCEPGTDGIGAVRGAPPFAEAAIDGAGFAVLGMICVPGILFGGSGGRAAATAVAPAAASNAPLCDKTLLTASGETGGAGPALGGGP